jgi:ribosome maturation factor RimP
MFVDRMSEWALCPFFISVSDVHAMASRVSVLTALIEPVINAMGYQLWGVEYLGQGKHSILRVYLEKEGGVYIEDCAQASRQISSLLDVEDPIKSEYTLEVSSPGMDRMLFSLEQFQNYAGYHAKLKLTENFEGQRNFTGQIKAVENEEVVLIMGDEEFTLPYELIEKANIISQV